MTLNLGYGNDEIFTLEIQFQSNIFKFSIKDVHMRLRRIFKYPRFTARTFRRPLLTQSPLDHDFRGAEHLRIPGRQSATFPEAPPQDSPERSPDFINPEPISFFRRIRPLDSQE